MIVVELHKTFVGGLLAGLSVVEQVRFRTWREATDFAHSRRATTIRKPCGGSPYRVDFAFAKEV